MVTWVEFEYEHVINASFAPAIGVDGQEKCDQHKEENPAVNTNGDVKLPTVICKESWKNYEV